MPAPNSRSPGSPQLLSDFITNQRFPASCLINLLEPLTELRKTLKFTCLSLDMIQDTNEQADEEILRDSSARAEVSGYRSFCPHGVGMCHLQMPVLLSVRSPPNSILQYFFFFGGFAMWYGILGIPFAAPLHPQENRECKCNENFKLLMVVYLFWWPVSPH